MKFAGKWIELENIILSEVTQTQKDKHGHDDKLIIDPKAIINKAPLFFISTVISSHNDKLNLRKAVGVKKYEASQFHEVQFIDCCSQYKFVGKCMELEKVILTEAIQTQKDKHGSISNLLGIMGIPKDGLQNLANTLEGDKDLNSPRELSAEAEKELAIVEKTIREAHVDRVNPELKCILVILPSRHSPTGILMQREDVILEWIFLPRKPNKKLKTYIEKISDLIHKEQKENWRMKFGGNRFPRIQTINYVPWTRWKVTMMFR
ncbi:hypothetical protein STEG23_027370 [Scotinomys teguina]